MPVRVRLWARLKWIGKGLFWIASALLLLWSMLLGVVALFLAWPPGQTLFRRETLTLLQTLLETDVELRHIRLSGVAHLTIEGLVIYDKNCLPFLKVEEVQLSWLPSAFWRGFWKGNLRIPVTSLDFLAPDVYIYKEKHSGLTNVDRLFPSDTTPSSPSPWKISLAQLRCIKGTFRWRDSTEAEANLLPSPRYLRYANLWLDSISFQAEVEWESEGHLFASLKELTLREKQSSVRINRLSLVLEADTNSTLISHLDLHLPYTHLQGQGHFPKEGLDKLFRNTETKLFVAQLGGTLDWRELYAFIGDSVPISGRWNIALDLVGDLYRLHASSFHIEIGKGKYIEGEGEIYHYAHPQHMHWEVSIQEAALSLRDVEQHVPAVAFPDIINKDTAWRVKGSHRGTLSYYEAVIQIENKLNLSTTLSRDTSWKYELSGTCENWDTQTLFLQSPISQLTGTFQVRGENFSWDKLHAELRASLSAIYQNKENVSLWCDGRVQQKEFRGSADLKTSYGEVFYEGEISLTEGGAYKGLGKFQGLQAALWGSEGALSGNFRLHGSGILWKGGEGRIQIDSLHWEKGESKYFLGSLSIESSKGERYELKGPDLLVWIKGGANWKEALLSWLDKWEKWHKQGLWEKGIGNPTEEGELALRIAISSPTWLHVAGVSFIQQAQSAVIEASWSKLSDKTIAITLHAEWDSLVIENFSIGASILTLHLSDSDTLGGEMRLYSKLGESYLSYKNLNLSLNGSLKEGKLEMATAFGERQDTLNLFARWSWERGNMPIQLAFLERTSFISFADHKWSLHSLGPVQIGLDGEWLAEGLRLETQGASAYLRRDPFLLLAELEHLPIQGIIGLLGYSEEVGGYLNFRWESYRGSPRFFLRLDSLAYKAQPYPQFLAEGRLQGDSIYFTTWLTEGNKTFVNAKGHYVISDSLSPLYVELRGLKIPAVWLSPFLGEYLRSPKGFLRSQLIVLHGHPSSPRMRGEIFCDEVSFYVPLVRMTYTVEGNLLLRGDTLYLPDVMLKEVRGNLILVSGFIGLSDWRNPYLAIDMQVRESPFLLAATPPNTDAYLYGRVELDGGTLSLVGPWHAPYLRGELRFAETTDLTLPLQTYERSEGMSHVRFAAQEKKQELQEKAPSSPPQAPEGLEVRVALRSGPKTRFRLIFDERSGDEVVAQGVANLLFSINRYGEISLSGSYEIYSGEYQVNLQGIASKKLSLEAGGTISWDGDLYEGQMNLTAVYRTVTSLRVIDTSFTSTVPVELRVFLRGSLLAPTMNFQLDIPSFSGSPTPTINIFLQRLVTDELERNRQVFALLVFGSFVPLDQGWGSQQVSSGVSSTLAEFISSQLTGWVSQTLGSQVGVALSLGQWNELSAQLRLSIGQRFVLERDGVVVAPGQTNASLGNLSARYRLLPRQLSQPTQLQVEIEGFSRQTFMGGVAGTSTQGGGLRLRKSFYLPERKRKSRYLN
ncbi:MAG: translocation/assembly module TamB domain-containing protein [Bacteroidia bacterium]|nr:translocation/assembly module TamB [Bacteroidia bacterium]MDW8133757.1 translocation/assembly module TamB domain-containing protein [Bacteroidia bacterium]